VILLHLFDLHIRSDRSYSSALMLRKGEHPAVEESDIGVSPRLRDSLAFV
jgi:hypothetical protein